MAQGSRLSSLAFFQGFQLFQLDQLVQLGTHFFGGGRSACKFAGSFAGKQNA
jgi:hypothetical protein